MGLFTTVKNTMAKNATSEDHCDYGKEQPQSRMQWSMTILGESVLPKLAKNTVIDEYQGLFRHGQ